jgi:hypothetical protein
MMEVSILRILGLLMWEFWEKCHLRVASKANHRKYCKEEGGGFPQIWAVVNFVNPCMCVPCLCTKNIQTIN